MFGTQDPFRNLAPAFVWIAWWIGFTYLSALAGDLWALLNPWNALYLWAEALARRIRPARPLGLNLHLPDAVGAWPAAALLLAFSWIEIVWEGNAIPASIAWLALGYSALTWAGMFVFGRETWLKTGEFFAVYFGWLARLAPSEVRTANASACEWRLRPPAAGLLGRQPVSPLFRSANRAPQPGSVRRPDGRLHDAEPVDPRPARGRGRRRDRKMTD